MLHGLLFQLLLEKCNQLPGLVAKFVSRAETIQHVLDGKEGVIAWLRGKVGELEAEIARLVRERDEKEFKQKAMEMTMAAETGMAEKGANNSEKETEWTDMLILYIHRTLMYILYIKCMTMAAETGMAEEGEAKLEKETEWTDMLILYIHRTDICIYCIWRADYIYM